MKRRIEMNNFTKEELQDLLNCWTSSGDAPWPEKTINGWGDKMADKIQSLIDNYCERNVMSEKETWAVVKDYERKIGEIEIVFGKYDDIWMRYADAESITYFKTQNECEQYRDKLINE